MTFGASAETIERSGSRTSGVAAVGANFLTTAVTRQGCPRLAVGFAAEALPPPPTMLMSSCILYTHSTACLLYHLPLLLI
jgi:hypothetical protein